MRRWVVAALLLVTTATCIPPVAVAPLGSAGVPIGSAIRLTLTARDLPAVKPGTTDTTWLRGARIVVGRIQESAGDTIRMTVSEAGLRHGRTEFFQRNQLVLSVPRDSSMRIQVISPSPSTKQSLVTAGNIGFGLAVIAALFVLWCTAESCFGN